MGAGSPGRPNQRERTRRAIVGAAVALVQAGRLPSMPEVAAEALVSTATAYRYFPDQLSLLSAALQDGLWSMREDFVPSIPEGGSAADRVATAADRMYRLLLDREPLIRAVMALSLLRTVDGTTPRADAVRVRPGFRREWIDAALRPAEERADPVALRRLKLALGVVIGPEALVALEDTMGVSQAEALAVCEWMARTLTTVALTEPLTAPGVSTSVRSGRGSAAGSVAGPHTRGGGRARR
ncbi:MAG: TetR/AcrR family transcriptional regulator [Candidatus Dormibacteria bacterium]